MPTYEYRCSEGHAFEQFQRMSEEPLRACTVCGAPAERIMSAGAGLLFKGSGFYITDYRSDSYRKAADADSGSGAGSSGSAAGTTKSGEGGKGEKSGKGEKAGEGGKAGASPAKDAGTKGGSPGSAAGGE